MQKTNYKEKLGQVFNLQRYSLHDGEGIRTTVFLKGCTLHCQWCSNPESQKYHLEIAFNSKNCIGLQGCDLCLSVCHKKAINVDPKNGIMINRALCDNCNLCTPLCPTKALHPFGEQFSIQKIINFVEQDDIFYNRSKGGLTISGGEPLLQGAFTLELIKSAKKKHIAIAIETCGDGAWFWLEKIAQQVDEIFFDIKSMSEAKHRQFTGRSNRTILANFTRLVENFSHKIIHVRTPIIPNFNHQPDEIMAIVEYIEPYPFVTYELLPYHEFGKYKYTLLGRDYPLMNAKLDENHSLMVINLAKQRLGTRYHHY